MKKLLCLILGLSLFLCGCSGAGEWIKEPVTFYYVRKDYQKDMTPAIASEVREASGHKDDLSYLLALYCMGPSTEGLRSPLPRITKIIPTEQTDDSITLILTEGVLTMTEADYTLASACLAMTCMELTGAARVTVICQDKSVTIEEDNLLLDSSARQTKEETK